MTLRGTLTYGFMNGEMPDGVASVFEKDCA